jgi:hypothetical protein
MANLNLDEFEQTLSLLADGGPAEKLRDRLVRLNAFTSRRGLGSIRAIAERLFALSSGLRRDVPATRAHQALWTEYLAKRLTEKSGSALDELAEKINATLDSDGSLREGQEETLDQALAEYENLMARKVGGQAARLDMLQKAVPLVAAKLRQKAVLELPLDPPEPEAEDAGHDHAHHDHAHHDHAHHDHAHHDHVHEDEARRDYDAPRNDRQQASERPKGRRGA